MHLTILTNRFTAGAGADPGSGYFALCVNRHLALDTDIALVEARPGVSGCHIERCRVSWSDRTDNEVRVADWMT